jgi:hypothetical protein
MGWACSTKREDEFIYNFGGKARRKEATRKTTTYVGG